MSDSNKNHYINGEWRRGDGKSFESINPATGAIAWRGHTGLPTEVNTAATAARLAFEPWAALPLEKRIEYLNAFQKALRESKEHLSQTISIETGKPLWESNSEVDSMINKIPISIDAYHTRCKETVKELGQGKSITRHRPHGVVAVLGPFNFPGHLPNGHIVPALLAGNTVIFKPSELTPSSAVATLECWDKAKLPPGVINMIQGAHEPGSALAQHHEVDGLFFTGSYRTGKMLSEMFGKHPEKILALEMGGNNPLIVSDVSDLKAAALLTIQSAFLSSGQRCSCARRLIVPQGAKGDAFIAALIEMMAGIHVGRFTEVPEPFMGPVISESVALKLLDAQQAFETLGAKILVPMHLLKAGTGLVTPALIDVTDIDRHDDEYFGPLLQLIRVPNFEAAIQEANHTKYGLSAGLLSGSKEEYESFYNKVRAGIVNWNAQTTGASSAAPFGGVGYSGNHRPSAYYAADYCCYPVASTESEALKMPATAPIGIKL